MTTPTRHSCARSIDPVPKLEGAAGAASDVVVVVPRQSEVGSPCRESGPSADKEPRDISHGVLSRRVRGSSGAASEKLARRPSIFTVKVEAASWRTC
jgi:hypothetical protein